MVKENTLLYEMLSEWTTSQLDERLAQELHKETVDEETVRTILAVLREREKEKPVEITPQIQSAWEKYQKDSVVVPKLKPKRIPTGLLRAASICIVIVLLFSLIPTNAQADNFWERMARWTNEVFEFFSPHAKQAVQESYVFTTDNPGLQQVYDAVINMGIAEPVVPMWLPNEYSLIECSVVEEPNCKFIHAKFCNGQNEFLLEIRHTSAVIPGQYEKDNTEIKQKEILGIVHYIMRNNDRWNVAWNRDNLDCFFTIDCQESILYDILMSIYILEGNA